MRTEKIEMLFFHPILWVLVANTNYNFPSNDDDSNVIAPILSLLFRPNLLLFHLVDFSFRSQFLSFTILPRAARVVWRAIFTDNVQQCSSRGNFFWSKCSLVDDLRRTWGMVLGAWWFQWRNGLVDMFDVKWILSRRMGLKRFLRDVMYWAPWHLDGSFFKNLSLQLTANGIPRGNAI